MQSILAKHPHSRLTHNWPASFCLQYVRAADAGSQPTEDTIFRLPADFALKEADVFKKWSTLYAADEEIFKRDFQLTYQRAMQVRLTALLCHCTMVSPAAVTALPGDNAQGAVADETGVNHLSKEAAHQLHAPCVQGGGVCPMYLYISCAVVHALADLKGYREV